MRSKTSALAVMVLLGAGIVVASLSDDRKVEAAAPAVEAKQGEAVVRTSVFWISLDGYCAGDAADDKAEAKAQGDAQQDAAGSSSVAAEATAEPAEPESPPEPERIWAPVEYSCTYRLEMSKQVWWL